MISRRNIRVKVMQTLYTITTLEKDVKPAEQQKILEQHFDQTRSLFIYLIYFLTEVTGYAETDAQHRAAKHLPTYEDLHVNTRISANELLRKMLNDSALKEQFSTLKPELILDKELVKKIYHDLSETAEYKSYIMQPVIDKNE
ncbi:MAG TPA: transcription antitermination factor NusB, partial [Chitinophagaceae bacterium]|nr:transcription antitermination factor NusB [Chitinophagaceae bacterium]